MHNLLSAVSDAGTTKFGQLRNLATPSNINAVVERKYVTVLSKQNISYTVQRWVNFNPKVKR